MRVIISAVGAGMLSACTLPSGPAAPRIAPTAPMLVVYQGADYMGELRSGPPGTAITRAGAVPTQGLTIAVSRAGAALLNDEGRLAKSVAQAMCDGQGGRHNPAALGTQAGGVWTFAGACA